MTVLSSSYFGNIQYFSKFLWDDILIEQYENYTKQSYRNRCDILSANGTISLIVPTIKKHGQKILMKDIEIDYSMSWQKQHFRSIISAYGNSPYFEYYIDKIEPIFVKNERFLIDLNQKTTEISCDILKLNNKLQYTNRYTEKYEISGMDYREVLSPKLSKQKSDDTYIEIEYYQVFSDKMEFKKNLSILDLILCEGPNAKTILQKTVIK